MKISLKTKSLLAAFIVLSISSFSQMRQVYLDAGAPDNEVYKFSFYSPSEGFVAFRDWIGYTTDSGRTFTKKYITLSNVDYNGYSVNLLFGFGINGVKAFNKDTLIAYGEYGLVPAILYSTNGGNNFKIVFHSQFIANEFNSGVVDMVFPENNAVGFAVDPNRVLKTTDRGRSWTPVYSDANSAFAYIEAPDNNNVFALSPDYVYNKVVRSVSGGTSWQNLIFPSLKQGKMTYAHFPTASKGFLSMYDGDGYYYFYSTINAGVTWTLRNNIVATPFGCGKMRFVNDSTGFALSGQNTVYKTTDYGSVWEPLPRDNSFRYLNYSHNDLACLGSNQLWAGGGHGFIELNTNPVTLPKAFFLVDTSTAPATGKVQLVNYSKKTYQYQWFVNRVLISTDYNASYTRNVYSPIDTIQLIVTNGGLTDTLTRIEQTGKIPRPVITSFTPASGTMGSTITITGDYFISCNAVSFGGVPATSFTVVSPTTITAVVGTGASGRIRITTKGGADSVAGFTFIPPPPVIQSFSPTTAIAGSVITITGNFFMNASAVSFGGVPAVSFTVLSQTTMKATVGAGASGNVSITTPTGTGSLAGFTLEAPVSITSFSPASGPAGTTVTITGNRFNTTAANNIVYFGGVKATVLSASATSLSVKVPYGATYVPITVTTNGQTASATRPFVSTFTGGGNMASGFQDVGTLAAPGASSEISSHCSLGDIDGDGLLDILTGNTVSPSSFSLFRNTSSPGDISFGSRTDVPLGYNVAPNLIRDMNMDGKPDIVLYAGTVKIAQNNSTPGNFLIDTPIDLIGASTNFSLAIGDIDGDGRPDVVAPTALEDRVTIWRNSSNNGQLSFEPAINYTAGDEPWGVALADLDGDKKPEMIVCNYYDHQVTVYSNNSTPGKILFGNRYNFPVTVPSALAAGDFDGDGKTDLAVAAYESVAILRNTSTGIGAFSFAPLNSYPSFDPFSVEVADMDGDGKVDVVTANQGDQTSSIHKNNSTPGTIAFAPRVTFTTGPGVYPRSAPVGDLDNDGKPDFLYVNFYKKSATIFRNRMNESFAKAGKDVALCSNEKAMIGTSPLAGTTYSWTSNPAGFTAAIANPQVQPTTATTYYLQATNNGVTYYDTVAVSLIAPPVAHAGPDQTTCFGASFTIGTPAVAGHSYQWFSEYNAPVSSVANPVLTPSSASSFTYYLTVTAPNGCRAKDTVVVLVYSTPTVDVRADPGSSICPGTDVVTFTATPYNAVTTSTFQWQLNGINTGTNSKTYTATGLQQGDQVKVLMTNPVCPTMPVTSAPMTITIKEPPPKPTITQTGVLLTSSAASGNQWFRNNLLLPLATSQTCYMTTNGIYTVQVTLNGCPSPMSNSVVYGVTAINSPELDNRITTGPNPVADQLLIRYNGNNTGMRFQLQSITGKVLATGTFTGSYTLDMRTYAAGQYILQVTRNNTHEQIHRAIIKQ